MNGILVYKTDDNYIELFKNRLEYIDYSCFEQVKNEDKLRDIFSVERISSMMLESDEVLDRLFDRYIEFFDQEQKKRYFLGKLYDNLNARLNVVGFFLEDRFNEKDGYLFARELEGFCKKVYEKDLNNNKTRG